MRLPLALQALALSHFLCFSLAAQGIASKDEKTVITPSSDGVDIEEIRIVRQATLGAVKEADLTNMTVELRLTAAWDSKEPVLHESLVRLHSLGPIEDDTGKVLTTDKRLQHIYSLQHEVRPFNWTQFDDTKGGPQVSLLLDAPNRIATQIKVIQGKAEVSLAKTIRLTFDDLVAINGKELSHPDMPSLKNQKLRFSIETKDKKVVARLSAPFNFAPPWFQGRLKEWSLRDDNGITKSPASLGKSPKNGGVTVERTFWEGDFDGWSLHLDVLEPIETKAFEFEFRNVPLP